VRVICDCGACREIEPEALARLVGWSTTLKKLALRMRCLRCGKKLPKWWRLRDPVARGTEESTLTKTRPKAAPSWGSSGGWLGKAQHTLELLCRWLLSNQPLKISYVLTSRQGRQRCSLAILTSRSPKMTVSALYGPDDFFLLAPGS